MSSRRERWRLIAQLARRGRRFKFMYLGGDLDAGAVEGVSATEDE